MNTMGWTKRVLLGAAAAGAMLGIGSTAASAGPPESAQQNHAGYWEGYGECKKFEDPGTPFELGDAPDGYEWTLLVIKAGSRRSVAEPNHVIEYPAPGEYDHPSDKQISHVIVCWDEDDGGYEPPASS